VQQQIGEVVDFNLPFFSSSENVTVKTLLKSVHIYQSYCKKNLAQFFFWPTLYTSSAAIEFFCFPEKSTKYVRRKKRHCNWIS